jgi:ELWxxDGT repeat protein
MPSSSLRRGALALLLLSVPALCQAGLAPRLVRDIDEISYAGSSSPRQFGGVEHGTAFTAFGDRELWIYAERDGVFQRVLQREKIRQLQGPYYAAREAEGGWSFWLADGHPYNSVRPFRGLSVSHLGAIYPSSWDSPVLFEADQGAGRGLWTIGGELARPLPFKDGRLARDVTPARFKSYFIARDRKLGTALWRTDGTKAGTSVLAAPSPGRTVPLRLAGLLRGRLLLAISGGEPELWWSDGKRGRLRPFTEIVRGRGAATVSAAKVVQGRAFLVIDDGRQGRQLWISDGTAAGTLPITSFAPDPLRQIDVPLLGKARIWYFVADDGIHGRELWRTDGTPQGTRLAVDFCPGSCSSDPQDLTWREFFDRSPDVFLTAFAPEGSRALWQTDGTPHGTTRLTAPGVEATSGIQDYGLSAFTARTAELGDELWMTEGTPESTRLWTDLGIQENSGSHPVPIGAAGDRLLFWTEAPTVEHGFWTSDGTAAGTYRIPDPPDLDLAASEWEGFPATSLGDRVLFVGVAREAEDYRTLWASDGTAAGGVRLTPPGVDVKSTPVVVGARAIFSAQDPKYGIELWVTEGTPESTHLLIDLMPSADPDAGGPFLFQTRFLRGQLLFDLIVDGYSQIWVTDGTAEGTRRLIDVDPLLTPFELSGHLSSAEVGDKLFFLGSTERGGDVDLWVSDGTAAGTAPLDYADANAETYYYERLFPTPNHLYFTVVVSGPEDSVTHLWVTDGTSAGTTQLPAPPVPPFDDYYAMPPMSFGNRLVFTGDEEYNLWVTDGTAEGTFLLVDAQGKPISGYQSRAIAFKNHLVVATLGDDGGDGPCYVLDAAAATARQLEENLSCGTPFVAAGDRLYFRGFQPQTGAELWVLEEK